jgi:hypothetical protein
MPPEPILADDGGSIRIRNTNGNGVMDGLLDVRPLPKPKDGIGSTFTVDGHFTEFEVVYQNKFGSPGGVKKQKFDTLLITCGTGKYVLMERKAHKLKIAIVGIRIAPMVEGSGLPRRYIVLNFGPIEKVESNRKPVYFVRKGIKKPIPDNIKMPVRFTSVAIT